ncbi:VOC family protein [Thaumasiovibrio sp. DFM-14]|uniref:VOC family protein n=1 Tax=Thaumasiovibrio sp. DFM-14 TaxID=3384792 RepID=UPI0039A1ECE5
MTPESLIAELDVFYQQLRELSADIGIETEALVADHVALRVNSDAQADALFPQWLKRGTKVSSAKINGRSIWIIQLDQPLCIGHWSIPCIELPYPGDKYYPREGWEHIELIVPGEAHSEAALIAALTAQYPQACFHSAQLAEKGITLSSSSPKGEGERLANPTVAFKRNGVCIKFHSHSILDIVASECAKQ